MKIKKNHQRKRYKHNVNRKRLNKTRSSTGKIKCDIVKEFWNDDKTSTQNFNGMGLSMDPNKTIPVPSSKQSRVKITKIVSGSKDCNEDITETQLPNTEVIEKLEAEASVTKHNKLRLPKSYIKNLIHFLDKYKLDYNSMVRDPQNHDQWTAKQFRQRIKKFISIPEQFSLFLEPRNLSMEDVSKWQECLLDD